MLKLFSTTQDNMERVLIICFSAAFGSAFYYWFSRMIQRKSMREFILSHQWLLYPNSICYWRTVMALGGFFLYFFTRFQAVAIFVFTFAAILDGVDGIVARKCNLVSRLGEWLDPMCDKLTYLPPLLGFAYIGILQVHLVWILITVEIFGQFFARKVLSFLKMSGAANNFGKIKAIICFVLVIFCSLLEKNPGVIDIADEILLACTILATASVVFKFVPTRLYADILSTLNFFCGVSSLFLTYNGYFARAIIVIIAGQLFDLFDGRMAEKHGGTKYGPYLDDIADFISFGIAPAYVMVRLGSTTAWIFALVFVGGVAYRLIRFVTVDKKKTDLPKGVFNGLPSPAGALVVLGAALVFPPPFLYGISLFTVGLMVSRIHFAHFGRLILKQVPKPLFFLVSAATVVLIAFVLKTKNVNLFGYMILGATLFYMVVGRKLLPSKKKGGRIVF